MDKAASALQDGVGFVKQAVELDKNKKFDEAVKYYDLAVYFLKIACNGKKAIIYFNFQFQFFENYSRFYLCRKRSIRSISRGTTKENY
jgi:hypothetical protein